MSRHLLFLAIAVTVSSTPPAASANQAVPTRDTFLATTWRLMDRAISILPPDGFPITFRPDGTVVTRNLGGITRWSVDGDELVLSDVERTRVIRLKWLPARGVFRDCRIPSMIPVYVFPESAENPLSIGCGDVPAAVLKLQVALDKAVYQPGERIVAIATLANVGTAPIGVRRSLDETGRSDGFSIELTKDSANALQGAPPPPSGDPTVGEPLQPGRTTSRQLVLNPLLGSLKPGKYRLTIVYSARYPHAEIGIQSEPITLEIIPPR